MAHIITETCRGSMYGVWRCKAQLLQWAVQHCQIATNVAAAVSRTAIMATITSTPILGAVSTPNEIISNIEWGTCVLPTHLRVMWWSLNVSMEKQLRAANLGTLEDNQGDLLYFIHFPNGSASTNVRSIGEWTLNLDRRSTSP